MNPMNSIEKYIRDQRARFEEMLGQMVEIPTVSMEPERKADIRKGAVLAAQFLESFGAKAEICETSGNPVVVGRFLVPGARRTLTIYNHLDVQPAQEPEWTREPFTFVKADGRYLGRGTTDDKGPALTGLLGARYAVENGIPLNIQFVWELEEEIGSPHFAQFLKSNYERLSTDSVLVSDTMWISRDKPAIPYGLRGMLTGSLILQTGAKDTHSGVTGGVARNSIAELAELVSRLHDAKTGRVLIPGFYKDVVPPTKKEIQGFLASGFNLKKFKEVYAFKSLRTNNTTEALKRIWCMPTFELHGLIGGYTGPGVKTIVPPRAEFKFSTRLVPNQQPEKILRLLRTTVKKLNPDVKVHLEGMLNPYLGSTKGDYVEAASEAVRYGFSRSPVFIREGGSIGAVVTMQKYWKKPIIFIGLSLPEHGYHAPNENFDWGQASGGIKAFVKYFTKISEL